jgi:hypothetical protein
MGRPKVEDVQSDDVIVEVLNRLLAEDADITARAIARAHPGINAASSITRSPTRRALLEKYQMRQLEYRRWRSRAAHRSSDDLVLSLADKDARIAELEASVRLLTASHVAMLRAVGEMGGFRLWSKFYGDFREARDKLVALGAMPKADASALDNVAERAPVRGAKNATP